jgi:ADP-ribose pyrophosphatase YjhB (NUDIX family)
MPRPDVPGLQDTTRTLWLSSPVFVEGRTSTHCEGIEKMKTPMSALGYITREDGKLLCVWNRAYQGWGLPGGKGEQGEVPEETCCRELAEEVGLTDIYLTHLYDAPTVTDSGRHIYVFKVYGYTGNARQCEMDSPVKWLTRDELLESSPFKEFYVGMFASMQ